MAYRYCKLLFWGKQASEVNRKFCSWQIQCVQHIPENAFDFNTSYSSDILQVVELFEMMALPLHWIVWCQLQITDIHDTVWAYYCFELVGPSGAQCNLLVSEIQ